MTSSLSNLTDNLTEGIHKIKYKYEYDNRKCETCGVKHKDCECCLEYEKIRDNIIVYKCFCCHKNYQKTFDEELQKAEVIC